MAINYDSRVSESVQNPDSVFDSTYDFLAKNEKLEGNDPKSKPTFRAEDVANKILTKQKKQQDEKLENQKLQQRKVEVKANEKNSADDSVSDSPLTTGSKKPKSLFLRFIESLGSYLPGKKSDDDRLVKLKIEARNQEESMKDLELSINNADLEGIINQSVPNSDILKSKLTQSKNNMIDQRSKVAVQKGFTNQQINNIKSKGVN